MSQSSNDQATQAAVKDAIDERFSSLRDQLIALARIPGIAWESFDESELERSAEAVAALFKQTQIFDFVDIRRSSIDGKPGAPAILAKRAAKNGKPQILLYAHHDVQPPGDEDAWKTKPFRASSDWQSTLRQRSGR